ncbi:hypothetical protein GLYMA_04G071300v4 [Glycine max]|uniref:Uncharacterized protein n=2 Tax=Glycine subgen. Soja TaxID=1462606 RepID=A0A0R0K569_SOYBN|nr:hypothetical protein JHK85_009559 [Glycine max]RZC15447.1 hypothetical protein D0Y65_009020 [Glycine soja]KAG5065573.1 hypothetical protein JHK86_009304 [Glycine max]KAH1110219.1 hypothetical protein GYH30_009204 [Glycine max]KRH61846.1 hypothetical protein GLYMA_04G071300v4 [Glycine max]
MVKKELLPQRMHSKIQDARSNCNHSSRRCIVEFFKREQHIDDEFYKELRKILKSRCLVFPIKQDLDIQNNYDFFLDLYFSKY